MNDEVREDGHTHGPEKARYPLLGPRKFLALIASIHYYCLRLNVRRKPGLISRLYFRDALYLFRVLAFTSLVRSLAMGASSDTSMLRVNKGQDGACGFLRFLSLYSL